MAAVWISRPRGAQTLAAALQKCGLESIVRPALCIVDAEQKPLDDFIANIRRFDVRIFVSAEAVRRVIAKLPPRDGAAQKKMTALAIGQATAAAMGDFFETPTLVPPVGDSREILALPMLQTPRGLQIAVLGGADDARANSVSPHLCARLAARGGKVSAVACYRRQTAKNDGGELTLMARRGVLTASVAYSGDTLRCMEAMTAPDNDWLYRRPLFAIHRNIVRYAATAGFHQPFLGPGDADAMAQFIHRRLSQSAAGEVL